MGQEHLNAVCIWSLSYFKFLICKRKCLSRFVSENSFYLAYSFDCFSDIPFKNSFKKFFFFFHLSFDLLNPFLCFRHSLRSLRRKSSESPCFQIKVFSSFANIYLRQFFQFAFKTNINLLYFRLGYKTLPVITSLLVLM